MPNGQAAARKAATSGFDSHRRLFVSKVLKALGQRRTTPHSTGWCGVFREWIVTKAMQDHPKVSSVGRAPDLESGCHGFDSRTAPQAENLLPREGNRRESVTIKPKGSGRPVGRPRVVVLVSTRRQCCGNTYRRYAVRGYRLHACRVQRPWKLSVV